jgi:hypothetical protein
VIIAGVTFYLDRQLGWEATEAAWVKAAVVAYFTLNSILTFWIWAVDAGEVFKGERKSGERVSLIHITTIYMLKLWNRSQSNRLRKNTALYINSKSPILKNQARSYNTRKSKPRSLSGSLRRACSTQNRCGNGWRVRLRFCQRQKKKSFKSPRERRSDSTS